MKSNTKLEDEVKSQPADTKSKFSIGTSLRTEVIESEREFDALRPEWEQLVEQSDVHIFQTYEWQRTWWKFFGGDNELRIILFYREADLVGIMPMFLDHFKVMGHTICRCLRMIGSRVMQPEGGSFPVELTFADYLSWIVLPGYERKVNNAFMKYLEANRHGFDELLLEEVPEGNSLLKLLAHQLNNDVWTSMVKDASVCPLIQLPDSWDNLLMNLSSNARYQIRRFIRRITKKKIFELNTAQTKDEVSRAFDDLVEFHQTRWHRLGQPGIFMDDRIHDFFREVTMRFHEKGWLLIKTVTAKDRCVAVDLLFRFKGMIYLIQRGYDDTSDYRSYSPGKVLLYTVIRDAIRDGYRVYDFLRGDERYKLRTATHVRQNKMISIRQARHSGDTRAKLNNLAHKYSHLKRKIRNERDVIKVYKNRGDNFQALSSYMDSLYRRGIKRILN